MRNDGGWEESLLSPGLAAFLHSGPYWAHRMWGDAMGEICYGDFLPWLASLCDSQRPSSTPNMHVQSVFQFPMVFSSLLGLQMLFPLPYTLCINITCSFLDFLLNAASSKEPLTPQAQVCVPGMFFIIVLIPPSCADQHSLH